MKSTLVTGATGFVGWHVARLLTERGHKVRALTRGGKPVRKLDVEVVAGDLRDPQSLRKAVVGCDAVFHVAADYRLWSPNPQELYQSNVDGTRNLLEAAWKAGVGRIVYTSTVGCVGFVKGGLGDETTPVTLEEMSGHYKRSKFLAEKAALELASQGCPVVIVNPTAPVGDHDFKPTPTGKIITDFFSGKLPAYLDTGLNFVDVRDTALGHLLAFERGQIGQRYILGCENLSLEGLLTRLGRIGNRTPPRVRIPYAVAFAAGAVSTAVANITGKEPVAPLEGVKMAKKKMWVSQAKAVRELGFAPGPVDAALERATTWFRENGYC